MNAKLNVENIKSTEYIKHCQHIDLKVTESVLKIRAVYCSQCWLICLVVFQHGGYARRQTNGHVIENKE